MSFDPTSPPSPHQSALSRLIAEAGRHLNQADYSSAIELLERAHRLDPGNSRIPLDLGYANACAYDLASAGRWFDKALQLASERTRMLMAIAERWSAVRQFDASGKAYEQVLEQANVPLGALYGLAKIYLRQRRLDKASEIADRAMQLHGTHQAAMLMRGMVYRQTNQLEEAEKMLRLVVDKPGCDDEARATALYELGAVLDRQQRYDEAMKALLDAKAILGKTGEPTRRMFWMKQNAIKEAQTTLSPAAVERWRKVGENELQPRRKLAVLCGHARSGTTLLEYVLDAHPQIVSADETSVFQSKAYSLIIRNCSAKASIVSGLDWITPRNLRQVRAEYFRGIESFLGQPIGGRLLIDKNPALTSDIPAICCILPETRFLVMLRDPRDVCLSCFMQPAPVIPDTVPWLSLEDTIKHYVLLADLWLALKPCVGNTGIEVRYEDLVDNLETGARRVLDFLGVGWDERVLRFHEHAQGKTICSPTYAEVTRPVFKTAIGRWRHYEKYFEPHLDQLAPTLCALGYE